MEIDDSSDKMRRNLVVFSFSIVAGTFLNLNIHVLSKGLSSVDIASISPFKLWIVMTFILIYLFYRYWFDDKTNNAINIFNAEFNSSRYAYITRLLNDDIANSLLGIRKPKLLIKYEGLDEPIIAERNKEYGKPVRASSTAYPTLSEKSPWKGVIESSYSIQWNGSTYSKSGGFQNEYSIPLLKKYWLQLKIMFRIVTYSKSVTELLTPIILFGAALFICFFKLTRIFF